LKDQIKTNQARGSVNKPETILGVDTDDEINEDDILGDQFVATGPTPKGEVLSLLVRFKLLRQAARCFEYIKTTNPAWGDQGEINRRKLLVSKLTPSQRSEFVDVFKLIDTSNDGLITLPETKAVLSAVDDEKSESMINKADPSVDGNTAITLSDFIGVMAEAERPCWTAIIAVTFKLVKSIKFCVVFVILSVMIVLVSLILMIRIY
jgi:hypothetical protein